MRNAGLEEAQAGIKTAGRNINKLRYADDTTLMAESEEELKNLLMKVKEKSEKAGLSMWYLYFYISQFSIIVASREDENMRMWDRERTHEVIENILGLGLDDSSTAICCITENKWRTDWMNEDKPLKLSILSVYKNWPSLDFLHQFGEDKLCSGFKRLITKVPWSTSSSTRTLLTSPLPAMHFGVLVYDLKISFPSPLYNTMGNIYLAYVTSQ